MSAVRFCDICHEAIDPERAEALPATRLCTKHAHEIDKLGGEFKVSISHDKTSKPGSLKKNFGGVTPRSRRNHDAMRKLREKFDDSNNE